MAEGNLNFGMFLRRDCYWVFCFWSKLLGFYTAKTKLRAQVFFWRDICSPWRSLSKLTCDTLPQLIYNQHFFSGQTSWSKLSRIMLLQTLGKWEACDFHFFLWLISHQKRFSCACSILLPQMECELLYFLRPPSCGTLFKLKRIDFLNRLLGLKHGNFSHLPD